MMKNRAKKPVDTKVVHILIVEDCREDALLEERALRQAGMQIETEVVETREAFLRSLEEFKPDVILCDYTLPHFGAMTALELALEKAPTTPVIIVTGSIDDETAVGCIKAGAADYVIKEHLGRLAPVTRAALEHRRVWEEKIRAEEALRESEDRYRDLVENTQDLMCTHLLDGTLTSVNAAAARSLGWPRDEIVGKRIQDFLLPEFVAGFEEYLATLQSHGSARGILQVITREGKKRIWEYHNSLRTEGLTTPSVRGMAHDITERFMAEKQLKESETKFRILAENTYEWEYWIDTQGQFVYTSPSCKRISGFESGRFIENPKLIREIVDPQDRAQFESHRARAFEAGVHEVEFRIRHANGEVRWIAHVCQPIVDGENRTIGLRATNRDITTQKLAEESLRRHSLIFESLTEGIVALDRDLRIVDWNPGARQIFGYSREEVLGTVPEKLLPPGTFEKLVSEVKTVADREGSWKGTVEFIRKGGERGVCEVSMVPLGNQHGGFTGSIALCRDLTKQWQAEDRLRTLHGAVEQSPASIVITDVRGNIEYVNPKFSAVTGYSREEVVGRNPRILKSGETPDEVYRRMWESIISGQEWRGEFHNRKKNGELFWEFASISPVRDPQGTLSHFVAVKEDITDRKRAEEAILKQNQQLRILSQAVREINTDLDVSTILRRLVSNAMNLVGAVSGGAGLLENDEVVFREFNREGQVVPIDYRFAPRRGVVGRVMQTLKPYIGNDAEHDPYVIPEVRMALGIYNLVAVPILNREGRILGCFLMNNKRGKAPFDEQDVNLLQGLAAGAAGAIQNAETLQESKRIAQSLKRSEEEYRRFFVEDISGDCVVAPDGQILACNPMFARIFGFSSIEEVLRTNAIELAPYSRLWKDLVTRIKQGERYELEEMEFRRHDGKPVYLVGSIFGEFDEKGELSRIKAYFFDDTERKKLEEQFRQSQKMEAVGRLAGGVAHDFNNILTTIIGFSDMLLEQVKSTQSLREKVEEIRKAGERAATLTRQLLAFSRKQVLQPKVLNLNDVISGMEGMLRRLLGEDISLNTLLDSSLGCIKADAGQLEQVLMNLAVNSRDAMPKGGALTIQTATVELDDLFCQSHVGVHPGRYVQLVVQDTGCGMNGTVLSHIFEPFFTTREKGQGTGLGLSTVYGIIIQSGGHVFVYSELNQGTTFKIYLPCVEARPTKLAERKIEPASLRGSETILIVEDDPMVRGLVSQVLETNGYTVLEASTPKEALLLFKIEKRGISMVVSDVIMPEMNGRELAEQLRHISPGLKILFMSGYTDDNILRRGLLEPGMDFLQKPFTAVGLTQKVRETLGPSKAS